MGIGQVDVEGSALFSKQVFETVTRGNDAKLYKTRVYSVRDGDYFSNRVIKMTGVIVLAVYVSQIND